MNILILNWRDPKNPLSGGAEKLNFQIVKPLIDRDDKVVWYGKGVSGLPSEENYKGIKIIRFGNILTYFLVLPFFLVTKRFGEIDFVIDCIHGIGNFTPVLMPRTKKKILIYEVAQNIWDETFPFPINLIGKIIERIMFITVYSKSKFWTISKSTSDDLINKGIEPENIKILPMGFDAPVSIRRSSKYKKPTALFVGRLVDMKGIKDAIRAVSQLENWELKIIGRGLPVYEKDLRQMVKKFDVENRVKFLGFTSEEIKFEEMSKAWVLLVPSSREGWGMIVGEANYSGTQVIGYNSPGLRDSIPFYSKLNIIVDNYTEMAHMLIKITNPLRLLPNLKPGWLLLHEAITKEFKNEK